MEKCIISQLSLRIWIKVCLLGSGTGSREYSRSCPWFAITKRESATFLVWREKPLWPPAARIIIIQFLSLFHHLWTAFLLSMRNFKLLKSCKTWERNIVRVLRNVKSMITVMDVFTTCISLIINNGICCVYLQNSLSGYKTWKSQYRMIQSDSHNSLLETSLTGKTILLSPQPNPYIWIIRGKTV